MARLNAWNSTWSLDEEQCPCDLHFVDYLAEKGVRGKDVFHMGTGNHHIVGLKVAASDAGNQVFAITASKDEYDAYVALLFENAELGFVYKVYFGDIYQIDRRLMPDLDIATLFHIGEYRTAENESYGALTDEEMTLVLADRLRPGGEIHFYTRSFAYDKGLAAGRALVEKRGFTDAGRYKTLHVFRKGM